MVEEKAWGKKGRGSEGVSEREMQFHPRLRQAIDGNSLQMKVISFHLLSIKRGATLIYSHRQMHSSAAETEIASPIGGWESVAFLGLTIKAGCSPTRHDSERDGI